jgi:hypothetical protein
VLLKVLKPKGEVKKLEEEWEDEGENEGTGDEEWEEEEW